MLELMKLYIVTDMPEKPCEIQLSENHEAVVANLLSVNNLYFLNLVSPEDI
jgi:hypothetical protein